MSNSFYEENHEQVRADYAFRCVSSLPGSEKGKYRSEVRNTAALMHHAGLMQTLAFYCSKMNGNTHYQLLTLHILKWVMHGEPGIKSNSWGEDANSTMEIFKLLLDKPDDMMICYSERAQALLVWLKRTAEGLNNKEAQ